MADQLERMTAAPALIKVGGKDYFLSPLTLADFATLEKWARRVPFEQLKEQLDIIKGLDLPPETAGELVRGASEAANNQEYIDGLVHGMGGTVKMLGLSLRKRHGDLKDEAIEKIAASIGVEEIKSMLDAMSNLDEEESKNSQEATAEAAPSPGAPSTEG